MNRLSDGFRSFEESGGGGGNPVAARLFSYCLMVWLLVGGFVQRGVAANDLPPGFSLLQVGGNAGIEFPVAMAFAPDGRIFVTEQKGAVRVIKNNQLLPTPFLTLNVHFFSERGLAGITFDPNFALNGYVYVYYSAMTPTIHNRLSRFTASGDQAVPGSEVALIDFPTLGESGFHNSGCLQFGRDGKLYVSVGENNIPAYSQSLATPMGKILRLNGDGTIPTDNPFYSQTTGVNRAIYALGFRNPFTFDFQPGTGRLFVNDVGYSSWEEVSEVVAGGNYGWPTYEGVSNDPSFKSPVVAYAHPPEPLSSAITGGVFYNPPTNQFPAQYVGKYFFVDGYTQWIRYIDLGTYSASEYATNLAGVLVYSNYRVSEFATNLTGVPMYLTVGPEGSIYYVAHNGNAVYKIQYSGQLAPQIGTQPSPQFVSVGYPASFAVAAYGAQPLTYQWQRRSAGAPDFSVIPAANSPTYSIGGAAVLDNGAQFRCVVANGAGTTNSLPATLTVTSDTPPVATILTPADGATFKAGDVLSFTGMATDTPNGELPPSALSWSIDIHHLTHTHPFLAVTNGFRSNSIAVPTLLEHDDRIWLRLHLTAVDAAGLSHSVHRDILPVKSTMTLATQPPGLLLRLNGGNVPTPTNLLVVAGVIHDLAADPQVINGQVYQFSSWSDGGAASHTINAAATNRTYTAVFTPVVNGTDSAEFVSQTFLTYMIGNQNYDVTVVMKNNGTTIWSPGTYFLGSQNPDNNTNWGTNRVSLTTTVSPGETAVFNFKATAPFTSGTYNMQWRLFRTGVGFFGAPSLNVPVLVQVRGNAAAFISQSVPAVMTTGQRYSVSVTMRNAGTNTWTIEKKHRLSSQSPTDNITWGLSRAFLSNFVLSGNNVTFAFTVTAPAQSGQYDFQWQMIQEAIEIFGEVTPNVSVTVRSPGDGATFVSQTVPAQMVQGRTNPVTVVMQNSGTNTWLAGSVVKLSSQNPQDNTVWGLARIALPAPTAPGQNAVFNFPAIAPTNPGTYNFQWRMIREGVNVFGAVTPAVAVEVLAVTNHAIFVSQTVPPTMNPGQTYTVTVAMKNLSTNTWPAAGGFQLGSINTPDNLRWGANRVALTAPVPPGATATLSFLVTAPNLGGTYPFQWQMIQDGVGYFGQPTPVVSVAVLPAINGAAFASQTVPPTMTATLSYNVPITFTNTGSTPWTTAAGYALRSSNPADNSTWSINRIALPATVLPGGAVTFNIPVVAPANPNTYNFQWQMSQDGGGVFGAPSPNVAVTVVPLVNIAAFLTQMVPSVMTTGLTYTVSVTVSNSGTSFWQPGTYQLAAANPPDNSVWGTNRVALAATVAPGGTTTLTFPVSAPVTPGNYSFQWQMLQVGTGTFGALSPTTTISVGSQFNAAAFGTSTVLATMSAGRDYAVSVNVTNTGTTTWSTNDFYELVSQNPLTNLTWGVNRLPVPAPVAPGQRVTFSFTVTAPATVGTYNFQWQMRQHGLGLFGSSSAGTLVSVTAVGNAARFVSQTVTTNMIPGARYPVVIRLRNVGTNTWSETTRHRLAAINPPENNNFGAARAILTSPVPPGQEAVFSFSATGPLNLGTYHFQWRMIQENIAYFGDSTTAALVYVADGLNNADYLAQTVPATMNAGQTYPVTITLTNSGTTTWTTGSLYTLAAQNPPDSTNWGVSRVLLPATVVPGATVTFAFNLTAPALAGTYNCQWRMLQEGLGLFGALTPNVAVVVSVVVAGPDASFVAQTVPSSMYVGQTYPVSITMSNRGGTAWAAGTYRLRAQNPVDNSTFGTSSVVVGAPVGPGAMAAFNFTAVAPAVPGVANFQWQMSQDGSGYFGAITPNVPVNVVIRTNDSGFVSQTVPATLTPGQVASASVTLTNLGNTQWAANGYRLASLNPTNNTVWGTNRIALAAPVEPGAAVTLTLPITAPAVSGPYAFQWQMIEEATGYFGAVTPNVVVTVAPAIDGADFVSQNVPAAMTVGQSYPVSVVMTNTGTTTWLAGSYRLGSQNPTNNGNWGLTAASLAGPVAPGGVGSFNFTVTPPAGPGTYNFQWQMVRDGVGYFGSLTPVVSVAVTVQQNNAGYLFQTVAGTMNAGVSYPVTITLTNTGGSTWTTAGGYALAPQNSFDNSIWSSNRIALPFSVVPGQAVTFSFNVFAPAVVGTYNFQWQMVQNGVGVFGAVTPNLGISVTSVAYAARFLSQTVPANMLPGQRYPVVIMLRTTGTNTWSETNKYRLSSHNPLDNATWGVRRAVLPANANIAPGQDGIFAFNLTAPAVQGVYNCQWRMLRETIAYFGDYTPNVAVKVTNSFDSAGIVSQSVAGAMNAGQTYPVSITLTNDGTTTWSAAANYRLVAQSPAGNTNWGGAQVPLAASVARSNTVTLVFNATAPAIPGTYVFQWQMMRDNAVFGVPTPAVAVVVVGATDAAGFVTQSVPAAMNAGQTYPVSVTFTNTGNTTWTTGASYRLAAQGPPGNSIWGLTTVALPASVAPGGTVSLPFTLTAPAIPGSYNFQWQLQHTNTYFGAVTPAVAVNVIGNTDGAAFVSQMVTSDTIVGRVFPVSLTFSNAGNTTWSTDAGYRLVAQSPAGNTNWGFAEVVLPASVAPTGVATFAFSVTAPTNAGSVGFQWQMQRGNTSFGAPSALVPITVAALSDNAAGRQSVPAAVAAGTSFAVLVTVTNTGNTTWDPNAGYALVSQGPLSNLVWGVNRMTLPQMVAPGQAVELTLSCVAPVQAGTYPLSWQMFHDGVGTFGAVITTPTVSVRGPVAGAGAVVVLDGTGYALFTQPPWTNQNTDFTIEGWVKPASLTNAGLTGLLGFSDNGGRSPSLWQMPAGGGLHFDSYSTNGTRVAGVIPAFFVSTSKWVHFAWVKEGTAYRFYRNGALFYSAVASESVLVNAGGFTIGNVGTVGAGWRGGIDTVRVWSRARTELELQELRQRYAPATEPGLMASWSFDDVAGATVYDASGNHNDGGLTGGYQWVTASRPVEFAVVGNTVLAGWLPGSEPFGSNLVFRLLGGPASGIGTVGGDGRFTYTPNDGFVGTDQIAFGVTGAAGVTSAVATATIRVFDTNGPMGNAAGFVTQDVPASMLTGRTYTVAITMANWGTNDWTAGNGYSLKKVNPPDATWGLGEVPLVGEVLAGGQGVFTFDVLAPGAPGDYNFQWQMFQAGEGLFGRLSSNLLVSVRSPVPGAAFDSQAIPSAMLAGRSYDAVVSFKNTGEVTWDHAAGFRLAAVNPGNDSVWGTNRVALAAPVAPGQTGVFAFAVSAPLVAGPYDFRWQMIQEGNGLFGAVGSNSPVSVTLLVNNAAFVTQTVASVMVTGRTENVSLTLRNTGDTTWTTAGGYALASVNPSDNTIWGVSRVSLTGNILPGQDAVFNFAVTPPLTPGTNNFQWQMIQTNAGLFGVTSSNVAVTVRALRTDAEFVSQSVPASMLTGRLYTAVVSFKNTGEVTWDNASGFRLAAVNPGNDLVWGTNRVALAVPVAPGQTGVFAFAVSAPLVAGPYDFRWQMIWEGSGLFGAVGSNSPVTVTLPVNNAAFVTQTVASVVLTGQVSNVSVRMRNTGDWPWTALGGYALASVNPLNNTVWGGNRAVLPAETAPGQEAVFNFVMVAPLTPGTNNFQWQMIQAGVGLFGAPSDNVAVTVRALRTDAEFVSQSVPTNMLTGRVYNAVVSFKNTGEVTWDNALGFRLAAVNPGNDSVWGTNRVALAAPVVPGQTGSFALAFSAPVVPGPYDFRWQMIQGSNGLFGQVGSNSVVTVTVPVNNALFVTQTVASVMATGQSYNVSVTLRNTGDTTWTTAAGYALASINPVDNTVWGGNRAPLTVAVPPGAEAVFNFVVTAPAVPANYNFQWQMVQTGAGLFGAPSANVAVVVRTPISAAAFVSQTVPTNLATGQTFNVSISLRNTGDTTWPAGSSFKLGSQNLADNTVWGTNRAALGTTVAPGAVATFTFALRAPGVIGNYNHQWRMMQEGVGAFGELTPNVAIVVTGALNAAMFVAQSVPATMVGAQRYTVAVTFRNTGTTTWDPATKYKLSAQNPVDNQNWGNYRILLLAPVLPGASVTFTWTAVAPELAGSYNFQWRMMQEGLGWFGQSSANAVVAVSTASNSASYVSQSVPTGMQAGRTNTVTVTVRNIGTKTWTAAENYKLGSQTPADNATWGLRRVLLPASIAPGANGVFTFQVKAPATAGSYVFAWKMIQEGVGWFGAASPNTTVTVTP